ncbi:Na+/H+ antiporter NhaA [Campylobacter concisus]|uniref:Na+/H+ antiporter NhaA n=1 Tax=Campylobacter concisus TaxID=199 RepID=UPI000CD87FF7|nr:Na+/H+ antiporter NhaA [Campylobacter concisus]
MGGIKEFLKHEASGGILLMVATIAALLCQNTFLSDFYNEFLKTKFTMSFGEYGLSKPLILWVNDGLMAVFFFLIGLELKREVLEGELGTALGLFVGKQIGVFSFSFLAIKFKLAKLPEGSNFIQLYGIAVLCGVGFTMSLFINSLAYNDTDAFAYADKLAILLGSVVSGAAGFILLKFSAKN